MKHYNVKPIRLTLRPSSRLAWGLTLAGVGASLSAIFLPVPGWVRLLWCGVALTATVFHVLRDALLRLPASIIGLEVGADGRLRCQTRTGGWLDAEVRGDSFITPVLTILNLSVAGNRWARPVLLLSDSADAEMFRRLRVWLRWSGQALLGR